MGQLITPAGADLLSIGKQAPRVGALPIFYEDWLPVGGIDAAKWVYSITSSGSLQNDSVNFNPALGFPSPMMLATGATLGGAVNLRSRRNVFPAFHGQTALTTAIERANFEFVSLLSGDTRQDNAVSFYGLVFEDTAEPTAATRTTENLIGWYWASDVLRAFVDNGGTETTSALTSAVDVGVLHKYKISLDRAAGVQYFVDDVLQATITTNIPTTSGAGRICWNVQNDVALALEARLGTIRAWMEDLI